MFLLFLLFILTNIVITPIGQFFIYKKYYYVMVISKECFVATWFELGKFYLLTVFCKIYMYWKVPIGSNSDQSYGSLRNWIKMTKVWWVGFPTLSWVGDAHTKSAYYRAFMISDKCQSRAIMCSNSGRAKRKLSVPTRVCKSSFTLNFEQNVPLKFYHCPCRRHSQFQRHALNHCCPRKYH